MEPDMTDDSPGPPDRGPPRRARRDVAGGALPGAAPPRVAEPPRGAEIAALRVSCDRLTAERNRLRAERDRLKAELALTRRRQSASLRQERDRLKAEARRSDRLAESRSRFLAVISHEIRAPVGGLIGLLDLIGDSTDPAERSRYLSSARTAAAHLLDLVNDVLDLARIDSGKLTLISEPFAPAVLLREMCDLLRPSLGTRPVTLGCETAADVAPELVGDAHRIRQILLNLAGNAVKFTREGEIRIRCSARPGPPPRLRFEVADTGPGIPEAEQPGLFDEYIQADLVRHRDIPGTGLGLAICKRLISALGGRIGFESREGRGSTFWFEVPVTEPPPGPGPTPPPAAAAPIPADRPLGILLAEDTPTLRLVVRSFLEQAGHRVDTAETGIEALDRLEAAPYDLAVIDLLMPGLDGDEVLRRMRQGDGPNARLPVIVLTAATDADSLERLLAAGADLVVPKPARRDALLAAVAGLMPDPPARMPQ